MLYEATENARKYSFLEYLFAFALPLHYLVLVIQNRF